MNNTESKYAEGLEARRLLGEIKGWAFEAETLTLAPGCTFTVDFRVEMPDGSVEMHEVKGGFIREDSLVKLRVAAEMFKDRRWFLCQWKSGDWKIKRVGG